MVVSVVRIFLIRQKRQIRQIQLYGNQALTLKLAGGGGSLNPPPLGLFGPKFSSLDQLPNAFAQLFLDNEDIF